MAAVERVLVAQGWHLPRWRTSNNDYGKFYKPHIPPPASKLHQYLPSQHIDYVNYGKVHPLRDHLAAPPAAAEPPSSSSYLLALQDSSGPPFVRTNYSAEINAHIQDLTLQDERPAMVQRPVPDVDERPPWRPKPLKPMILFEKKAKELDKERALDRFSMSAKRKISGDWPQESPSKKRQQIKYTTYNRYVDNHKGVYLLPNICHVKTRLPESTSGKVLFIDGKCPGANRLRSLSKMGILFLRRRPPMEEAFTQLFTGHGTTVHDYRREQNYLCS